jgi:hypothetical protein
VELLSPVALVGVEECPACEVQVGALLPLREAERRTAFSARSMSFECLPESLVSLFAKAEEVSVNVTDPLAMRSELVESPTRVCTRYCSSGPA